MRGDWHHCVQRGRVYVFFGGPTAHWKDWQREALHTFTVIACTESAISRMATTEETREGDFERQTLQN